MEPAVVMTSPSWKLFDSNMSNSATPFRYHPLDPSRKQIRLLYRSTDILSTSAWSLEHFNLAEAPPYRALSYAWGPEADACSIVLDGKKLPVRRNLHDFLATVDHGWTGPYLWVDQVCINQYALDERNHQVSIMADIYRNAFGVIVWLGVETAESAELVKFVTNYYPVAREDLIDTGVFDIVPPRRDMKYAVSENGRRLFDDLYHREYWSRLWPVQEMLLAQRLVIHLGKLMLSWDTLRNFHTWMIHTNSDFNIHYDDQTFLFQNALRRKSCDYSSLIQPAVQRKCADPRDKLYGLMSLLPPEMAPPVNYAQSVEETFAVATRIIMAEWQQNQQLVEVDLAVALEKCLILGHAMLPDRAWELNMRSNTPYYDMARYIFDTHLTPSGNKRLPLRRMQLEGFVFSDAVKLAIELLEQFAHSGDMPLMRFLRETRPRPASKSTEVDQSWWFDD
jgi:hypothetical protein